jgi:hypothetical protein
MGTKRRPIGREQRPWITPEAIEVYRRMQVWDRKHSCPDPSTAPRTSGRFNSAIPEDRERMRQYEIERQAFDAACDACDACAQLEALGDTLAKVLGWRKSGLWQVDIFDDHETLAALKQAALKETV